MHVGVAAFLRVVHAEQLAIVDQDALVADLAAGLRIERCRCQDDSTFVAVAKLVDSSPSLNSATTSQALSVPA